MAPPPPKYRGDEDDWLDEEAEGKATRAGAKKKVTIKKEHRAQELDPSEANATVAEVYPKQCLAFLDEKDFTTGINLKLLCNYRRGEVFGRTDSELRERAPVAVGDRIQVERSGDQGIVSGVCRRRNLLARPAPGRDEGQIHVIATNVDLLVIVASLVKPDFNPGLVDRFLVAAQAAGIEAILCVNKTDLSDQKPWLPYEELGVKIFPISAKFSPESVGPVRNYSLGKTVVFCGHSGVGKTTLLRALLKMEVGEVGDVSGYTGKGKHTTTSALIFTGPPSPRSTQPSRWIDTPGIKEFGLVDFKGDEGREKLRNFFPEFAKTPCDDADCFHDKEAGCKVRGCYRYPSYVRILQSFEDRE